MGAPAVSVTAVRPTTRSGAAVTVRARSRPGPEFASSWRRERLTVEDRVARGRAARRISPRSGHGRWQPAPGRPDPIALLEEQAATRVQELVPIRYGRMLVSPFTFFRGAALIMAADLAGTPRVGRHRAAVRGRPPVELRSVRLARAPDAVRHQRLRRDAARPWEWDVKRLAASFEVDGPRPRVSPRRSARDRDGRRPRVPRPDARGGGMGSLKPGTSTWKRASCWSWCGRRSPSSGSASERPRANRTWSPRRGPGTAPACWPGVPTWSRGAADRRGPADHRADRGARAARPAWEDPDAGDQGVARATGAR